MSFSNDVRAEISQHKLGSNIEALIELSAILKTNASISIRNAFFNINFNTESEAVSKRIYRLINQLYDYESTVQFLKNDNIQKKGLFTISIEDEKIVESLLNSSGIDFYGNYTVSKELLLKRLEDSNGKKKAAYLRGAFIGAGSIVNPKKNYHLEMIFNRLEDYEFTKAILDQMELEPLLNIRKEKYVLYFKDSEKIASFLNLIGATTAMLELENIRIYKDLRNNVNRQVNCDTANINKTLKASERQVAQIKYIDQHIGLNKLPEQLRDLAKQRLSKPDVSLKQLGQLMDPPISKSGVGHRMKKIEEIYKSIKS